MYRAHKLLILLFFLVAPSAVCQETGSPKKQIQLAILSFETRIPDHPGFGVRIAQQLATAINQDKPYQTLPSGWEQRCLKTKETRQPLLDATVLASMGKCAGADLLVVGEAFSMGKYLIVNARIIGTSSGLEKKVLHKSLMGKDMQAKCLEIAAQIRQALLTDGPTLLEEIPESDIHLEELLITLGDAQRPAVGLAIKDNSPLPHTSIQTEDILEHWFKRAGFEVIRLDPEERTRWFRDFDPQDTAAWPERLQKIPYLVAGELQLNALNRVMHDSGMEATLAIELIERTAEKQELKKSFTARALARDPEIANQKALTRVSRKATETLLSHFSKILPKATLIPQDPMSK